MALAVGRPGVREVLKVMAERRIDYHPKYI